MKPSTLPLHGTHDVGMLHVHHIRLEGQFHRLPEVTLQPRAGGVGDQQHQVRVHGLAAKILAHELHNLFHQLGALAFSRDFDSLQHVHVLTNDSEVGSTVLLFSVLGSWSEGLWAKGQELWSWIFDIAARRVPRSYHTRHGPAKRPRRGGARAQVLVKLEWVAHLACRPVSRAQGACRRDGPQGP